MVSAFGIPINLIIPFQEINLGVTRLDSGHTNPKIEELWFRAVHTDVGGGTGNYKLSNTWLV
jgi:hypothetical protein